MIVKELLTPKSIIVIGASNELSKPGGKVLENIIKGGFDGKLMALNPKETEVQGIPCVNHPAEIDQADLAIIAIASKYVLDTIKILAEQKGTKAFIILSAGFSEIGEEGKNLEEEVVAVVNSVGGSLIGPNCTGVLTPAYKGVFAGPLPILEPQGVDFVTGSGSTAVFILETAIPMGISFASMFSVGNSAQIGVEEVLKYWDESFDPETSSKIKMIYVEQINKPEMFYRHAKSLTEKGCKICAVKSGTTAAGSRAASSHTGALAGSDVAVDALFKKAGIVRCYGRDELAYTAGVFFHNELQGKNIAVITHAGGPGVMLTDELSKQGLDVPHLTGPKADELLSKLFHGSSVANPIDFLATGTAEQLGDIIDACDNDFDNIDGMVVIFGTPGLFDITPVYQLLHEKMLKAKKPIFPVLPSVIQAGDAIEHFKSLGRIYFQDEVALAKAIGRVFNAHDPAPEAIEHPTDKNKIRQVVDNATDGYLSPEDVQTLLDAAGIERAKEIVTDDKTKVESLADEIGYPLVMKVVGPVHKSDAGGVVLNVQKDDVAATFDRLMSIKDASSVLMQPMLNGIEIFAGAKKEDKFGHVILCGLGGIFIEVFKDVQAALVPVSTEEALRMIKSLKSLKLLEGTRGQQGADIDKFAEVIVKLSALLQAAPEISEMDLNPLLGTPDNIVAVDARIRIEK